MSKKQQKKYEFTGETKVEFGITLHRIRAVVAIAAIDVAAGDLGGWIEKESNLSLVSGDAWVSDNALVSDNARVSGNARVSDNARVYGNARVSGNAWVSGNARVYGKIISATRTDGYTFTVFHDHEYVVHIAAGCRYFTIEEARQHWRATRGGTKLGDESLALIDHLERMAKLQDWQKPVAEAAE